MGIITLKSNPRTNSLSRINLSGKSSLLLGGDFNLGHIDWSIPYVPPGKPDSIQHHKLIDILNDMSLEQLVDKPTRGERTLDIILTNTPSLFNGIKTLPPIGKSDHDIVFTECNTSLKRIKRQRRTVFKYCKANWENIRTDINTITDTMQDKYSTYNIDKLWDIFKTSLLTSINNNIPQKTITNRMKLPWVNNKLRKQINRNKRLHRKCKTNPSLRDKHNNNKRILQSDMRKAYWTYIENMIFNLPVDDSDTQCFKRTPKKLFSYIKSMKNEKKTGISSLRNNGILTNNTLDKANILNKQFQNAFTTESDAIHIPDKGPSTFPTMNNINITSNGITKLLQNINPSKATGPDQISGRVLKELSTELTPAIHLIFQKSLTSGKVPSDWKHANVCPIYKKGDKHNAINYRPVSLTCILCKLCEHIISSNLKLDLYDKNNLQIN